MDLRPMRKISDFFMFPKTRVLCWIIIIGKTISTRNYASMSLGAAKKVHSNDHTPKVVPNGLKRLIVLVSICKIEKMGGFKFVTPHLIRWCCTCSCPLLLASFCLSVCVYYSPALEHFIKESVLFHEVELRSVFWARRRGQHALGEWND